MNYFTMDVKSGNPPEKPGGQAGNGKARKRREQGIGNRDKKTWPNSPNLGSLPYAATSGRHGGIIAAGANHTDDKALERKLDGLHERIRRLEEAFEEEE